MLISYLGITSSQSANGFSIADISQKRSDINISQYEAIKYHDLRTQR